MDNKYTIDFPPIHSYFDYNKFRIGDWIDVLTGATIVGPYCQWPKTEPRYFVVIGGRQQGKSLTMKLAQQLREKFK